MSDSTSRRIAWGLPALAAACLVAVLVILCATRESGRGGLFPVLATTTVSLVGGLVAAGSRRQRRSSSLWRYRRRYDAQRDLEGFGARLHEQIDPGALGHGLRGVDTEKRKSAQASAWPRSVAP